MAFFKIIFLLANACAITTRFAQIMLAYRGVSVQACSSIHTRLWQDHPSLFAAWYRPILLLLLLLLLNVFIDAPCVYVWRSNRRSGSSHVISLWKLAERSAYIRVAVRKRSNDSDRRISTGRSFQTDGAAWLTVYWPGHVSTAFLQIALL